MNFIPQRNNLLLVLFLVLPLTAAGQMRWEQYDLHRSPPQSFQLPGSLAEISGMAFSSGDRLFVHNDETGTIYRIDPSDGSIVSSFRLGPKQVREDFEGLAVKNDTLYMVTGAGTIYMFTEGKNDQYVRFRTFSTWLTEDHDVEGLCYDPETDALLLACKGYSGISFVGYKAVFSYSLRTKKLDRKPRFLLSLEELRKRVDKRPFQPSSIEYSPRTKSFFILDSKISSIVELSPEGSILSTVTLNRKDHPQPEAMSFDAAGNLYIGDEGKSRGSLKVYRWKK